jgi:DNA-binding NtrC family response regulator
LRQYLRGILAREICASLLLPHSADEVVLPPAATCVVLGASDDLGSARALAIARRLRVVHPACTRIVFATAHCTEDVAIEALHCGVNELIRLSAPHAEISARLARVVTELATSDVAPAAPLAAVEERPLVGESGSIAAVRDYIGRVAPSDSTVLITGETGTGKELLADLVHRHSRRSRKPLVILNCAAVPDTLFESELFGHERGAFTGAHAAREGTLGQANGGTLFLDEIGEMSAFAQANLLRALESREVYRLGGRSGVRIDVRFIAATNHPLEKLVELGQFRKDLFYRLNVARVQVPPLRSR